MSLICYWIMLHKCPCKVHHINATHSVTLELGQRDNTAFSHENKNDPPMHWSKISKIWYQFFKLKTIWPVCTVLSKVLLVDVQMNSKVVILLCWSEQSVCSVVGMNFNSDQHNNISCHGCMVIIRNHLFPHFYKNMKDDWMSWMIKILRSFHRNPLYRGSEKFTCPHWDL